MINPTPARHSVCTARALAATFTPVIKMTNLPEQFLLCCRLGLLALVLSLAACGPGTGGTGTGPDIGSLSFSGRAGSSSVSTPGPAATTPDATPVGGCADCARVDLQIQDGSVNLATSCGQFVFSGTWGTDAS